MLVLSLIDGIIVDLKLDNSFKKLGESPIISGLSHLTKRESFFSFRYPYHNWIITPTRLTPYQTGIYFRVACVSKLKTNFIYYYLFCAVHFPTRRLNENFPTYFFFFFL